jgi:DNA-binding NarL/FixJ family response regulator
MRILLADDQKILRDGIRPFLGELSSSLCLSEAGTLDEAIFAASESADITLALLGHSMPGMNGIAGIQKFCSQFPNIRVVLWGAIVDAMETLDAIAAGAVGVISRTISGQGMVNALRIISSGEVYLSPESVVSIANIKLIKNIPINRDNIYLLHSSKFSPAEVTVLPLLMDGLSNKAIAQRLGIEEPAVKARLRNIFRKLAVNNRAKAVLVLMKSGNKS